MITNQRPFFSLTRCKKASGSKLPSSRSKPPPKNIQIDVFNALIALKKDADRLALSADKGNCSSCSVIVRVSVVSGLLNVIGPITFNRPDFITSSTDNYSSLDSEDDYRTDSRNVSHQQQFFSELNSPGRSHELQIKMSMQSNTSVHLKTINVR